jgi:hypothetical protein
MQNEALELRVTRAGRRCRERRLPNVETRRDQPSRE